MKKVILKLADLKAKKIRELIERKQIEELNSFNIGIPKELLSKEPTSPSKHKYDGGELPTFFARNKISNEMEEKDDKSVDEDSNRHKNNLNNNNDPSYSHVLNKKEI